MIYGMGAAPRACVMLNSCNLTKNEIGLVGEVSQSLKCNKYIPGTDIMVKDENKIIIDRPDYVIILAWHLTKRIINLAEHSMALHLIQQIRDEAHRFAITGHKQRRDKKRRTSALEGIPGVGPTRRRDLLKHFGGIVEVKKASVADLMRVENINKKVAEAIYGALYNE